MSNSTTNLQPRETIIFLHIPKTAGTTVYTILDRHFKLKETISIFSHTEHLEKVQKIKKNPVDIQSKIQLIKGHTYLGWHNLLPQKSTYFTILREPIDRFISYYYFVKKLPTHPLHRLVEEKNMSLEDFVCYQGEDNLQTRFLATIIDEGELEYKHSNCSSEILAKAKTNIQQYCSVIGIVEEFDRTLLLLKRKFGWNNIFYRIKNNNLERPVKKNISQKTLKIIEKNHEYDLELYEYSKKIFEQMIEKEHDDFEKDLYNFQKTNSSLFGQLVVLTTSSIVKFQKITSSNIS